MAMKLTKQGVCTALVATAASMGLFVIGAALVLESTSSARAQTTDWQLVPPSALPSSGTFFSMQRTNLPPMPFNRFPQLDVYVSSDDPERYWVDDRSVDYVALEEERQVDIALRSLEAQYGLGSQFVPPPPPGGGGGGGGTNGGGGSYESSYPDGSLFLSIAQLTNSQAPLTIHWTTNELLYEIQSKPALPGGSWTSEGGVLGAANQTWTLMLVPLGSRTNNLFFRARLVTNCDGYLTPAAWYVQYGLNPLTLGIGTQDANSNGLLNYQEYLWGSDPVHAQGFSVWVSSPTGYSSIP
jgi:hypothetical protein